MRTQNFFAVAALAALLALPSQASAQTTLFGLNDNNSISLINTASPALASPGLAINGVVAGENLIGIDYRPATNQVYTIGDAGNVYTLDTGTLAASLVGQFTPSFSESIVGFDFNPAFMSGEFARIIGSTTQDNSVISGNTGAYLGDQLRTDVFYVAGDPNVGATPSISGIAYTNSVAGAATTQQFGIDSALGVLTTVNNNAGDLVTIGNLGLGTNLGTEIGFDIEGTATTGILNVGNDLYSVDLSNGATTLLGTSAFGGLRDITAVPAAIPEPSGLAVLALAGVTMITRRRKQI